MGTTLTKIDTSRLSDEEFAEYVYRLEVRQQQAAMSIEERRHAAEVGKYREFREFAKAAWHIIEPGNKLSWSWHYDLLSEHLTLAQQKRAKRILINIPPRTLKSILVTVMFPVWCWTLDASQSFVCASYADKLSTEHSVKRRDLLESDWFRRLWGDRIWLAKDQNEKTKYKNNFKGQMIATSVGGTATGLGGNFLIVDDGLKPDEVASEPVITALHNWFDNTWRSRLNNPAQDVMIIVEQRTGELDLTGHCLAGDKELIAKGEKPEWTHICIPLEADAEVVDKNTLMQRFVFPISKRVKDRPLGDVLQPDRFPPAVVAAKKILRITWATQYQGRPSPLEGNMIKRSEVMYYGGMDTDTGEMDAPLPDSFDVVITSVDAAFKDIKTADFVCVGSIGVKGPRRYILEVVMKHLDAKATEVEAKRQKEKFGSSVVLIEDKANGSAIIKSMKRKVSGVIAVEPEGGKFSRFFAVCGEWQAGDWYVDRNAAWCEPFVDEITKFPGVRNDDRSDMMSQAGIHLQKRGYVRGLTEWLKQKADEMAKKAAAKVDKNKPAKKKQTIAAETATPAEHEVGTNKVDHPQGLAKPDVDDKTPRCSNCQSTLLIRIAGGLRCQNCGMQTGQPQLTGGTPQRGTAGMFRK